MSPETAPLPGFGPYHTLLAARLGAHGILLTLNRPEVSNALDTRMAEELLAFFQALEAALATEDLRILALTGTGDRAFCAGADLKERLGMDEAAWTAHHAALERAFEALRACPLPVVAAVHGAALGGGCELVLSCDLALASEAAFFAQPEVQRGIIPGCGATWLLPRRVGLVRAKELLLTGRSLPAVEALEWGLVNRVVAPGDLPGALAELAGRIAACGPIAVRAAKQAIDRGCDLPSREGLAHELELYRRVLATADREEGIAAFNDKRPPRFRNR